MISQSLIDAAKHAPDAHVLIRRMARRMRHHQEGMEGCCTFLHLLQDGFTEAEIHAYRDDARASIRGKPSANRWKSPDRIAADGMAIAALGIKRRVNRSPWATPVIQQVEAAHG